MSDESEHTQKTKAICVALTMSGILDGYGHQEVVTALMFMAARSVARDKGLSALLSLQLVERTVATMKKHERATGQLERILSVREPERPS
jgi:hypothetical protein